MPAGEKKRQTAWRAHAPAGKTRALLIIDADVIRQGKLAAEDEKKMSHSFDQAARKWLVKTKTRSGAGSK
jgi:hypothetical protein